MTETLQLQRVLGIWVLGFAICAGGAAGCARAQAKTVPDGPPLDVPAPPARVIAPAEEPIATAPAEPLEPAPAPASTNRRPLRRSPSNSTEPSQKPEPAPPAETPLPQAAPPEPAVTTTPVPTLRAPGSAEKPIRDLVVRAQSDLSRVDYAKLSDAGKMQYEQSKRFAQQAEQALKEQNFVFAQTLAEKAALLAAELSGR
jgi:hypothetical protein